MGKPLKSWEVEALKARAVRRGKRWTRQARQRFRMVAAARPLVADLASDPVLADLLAQTAMTAEDKATDEGLAPAADWGALGAD